MAIQAADEKRSGAIVICYVRTEVVFEVGGGLRLFEEPPEKLHGKILNTKQKYEKMCDVLRTKLTWWWRRSN